MMKITVVGLFLLSSAWGQSPLPTLDDCDKIAFVAAKLSGDLGKISDASKKAELIRAQNSQRIENRLASCRLVAMSHSDITRVNNYADLETGLLREDYDTLRRLTQKLQAECH